MSKKFSFAARLRAAQDVLAVLKIREDYIPLRPEESKDGLEALINLVISANDSVMNLTKEKKLLVKERRDTFYTGQNSVTKNFTAIKAYVRHQYGRNSGQMELLDEITQRMKTVKAEKAVTPETTAENAIAEGPQLTELVIVRSGERTYASLTKNFFDFLATLESFEDYKPVNEAFTIDNLKAIGAKLNTLNNDIALKELEVSTQKQERKTLYDEMTNRTDRVKLNIRAKYGVNSSIYKQIHTKRA